jgi:hypothetical protein
MAAMVLILSGCHATHSSGTASDKPATGSEASILASAPADIGPDHLSGLARAELTTLLGAPDFGRRDGPAEILQYRNGTCILDIFLYRESASEAFRVAHVEARNFDMQEVPGEDCMRSLRETRQNRAG